MEFHCAQDDAERYAWISTVLKRFGYSPTAAPGPAHAFARRYAPAPDGRHGFIHIDSVHQGNLDGVKGLHHINAVDCVTQ